MNLKKKIRVLIAGSHRIMREGLSSILGGNTDIEVVGAAEDGHDAVEKARLLRPDVVILDMLMPRLNGAEAARRIKKDLPEAGVLAFAAPGEDELVFELVRAGASGFLLNDSGGTEVADAVRAVFRGEAPIHPIIGKRMLSELSELSEAVRKKRIKRAHLDNLSEREVVVLKLLGGGRSNKEIAHELELSEKTVKNHIRNIFRKLNVRDRTQAAIYAYKKGIIRDRPL